DRSDTAKPDAEQVNTYRYGLDGQRISQDTRKADGSDARYNYSIDPRGNVEAITNTAFPSGFTAATYAYTTQGQDIPGLFSGLDKPNDDPAAPPKTPVNVYRFGAQQFDQNTGTYNVGFRDYSPAVSSFLTPDHYQASQADLALGPVPFDTAGPADNRSVWDWVKDQGRAFVNHVKEDPEQFVNELAFGIAVGVLVGAVCTTGIGCVILAGAVAGAASAAYGYAYDVAQGEHDFNAGDFTKQTVIGGLIGGATAGIGYGIGRGISRLLGTGERAAAAGGAAAGADTGAVETGLARAARTASGNCANSFTGATLVLMADGSKKPIKDVELGDEVMATDPATGEQGSHKVVDLIRHSGRHTMVAVHLANGATIDATDHHPFWVESKGKWVDAIDLVAGDVLRTADGRTLTVSSVGISEQDLTAYNLTVEGVHTYYVVAGDTPVLVHNACITSLLLGKRSLALGVDSGEYGVQDLAERIGADHLMGDTVNWRSTLQSYLTAMKQAGNEDLKLAFEFSNLPGGTPAAALKAARTAVKSGGYFQQSQWELVLIEENGLLDRTQFYYQLEAWNRNIYWR
ncbi:MAG: hypothetical protein J2P17_31485, partial [Mycobacterium sp.]|nr:hypothetical protein [Mycobacterium sp.]